MSKDRNTGQKELSLEIEGVQFYVNGFYTEYDPGDRETQPTDSEFEIEDVCIGSSYNEESASAINALNDDSNGMLFMRIEHHAKQKIEK